MSLNLGLLYEDPLFSIGLVCILLIIKVIVLFPITLWFGNSKQNAIAVSLVLAQSGEFAMVLFSLAYQSDILNDRLFQQLLLIVLLSMLATPALANFARYVLKNQCSVNEKNTETPVEAPIVLVGFGRVGHRIGEILSLADIPFVALDFDAFIVEKERIKGHPVFYGDVRKPELLEAAGAKNAQIIIVTLNDPEATEQVVSSLQKVFCLQ